LSYGDFAPHSDNLHGEAAIQTIGTASGNICSYNRGAFSIHKWEGMHSLTDGTSNTLLASERCIATNKRQVRQGYVASSTYATPFTDTCTAPFNLNAQACLTAKGTGANLNTAITDTNIADYSGKRWIDGAVVYTGFNTILPPNAPSCIGGFGVTNGGIVSASSFHSGGVNSVLADGAVKFFSETIDTTGLNGYAGTTPAVADANKWVQNSGKSWHGVWGALGSRNGGESVSPP
jgi:hypothetical protein